MARSEPRELRVPGSVVPGDANPLTTGPVPDDVHVAWTQAEHLPNVREPQVHARYNRQLPRWQAAQLGVELFGLDRFAFRVLSISLIACFPCTRAHQRGHDTVAPRLDVSDLTSVAVLSSVVQAEERRSEATA